MGTVLIKIDDEPHEPNEMMDPSLYEFLKHDSVVPFKSCVRKRSAKELQTPAGNSLLHVAVSYGSDNITSYLAETFPSLITIQNSQKDTILHLAAREGKASHTIKSLAESNPSLMRKKNTKGNTPLHDAVITDNKEVAKLLVSRDPEVAYYNNKNGRSPLYLAVENGNKKEILDDLLKTEASFPTESEDGDALPKGKSPVHAAIEQRNRDLLGKIAKAKPELLCLTDEELRNSLHYASSICFLEGVRFLLKNFLYGAYKTNSEGNYPIHVACKNESVDLGKEFLDIFPYPKEFLNKKGQNIIHVAAENGQGNVVRYILENDQKIVEPLLNEMDEDGNTPLHLAARHGQSMAAFVLVRDKRVENSIVNNENFTPYDVAKQQSKIAADQYDKTDEMLAKERQQLDSKNSIHADQIQIEVNSEDVKDGKKNSTTEKSTASTGSQRKDKAVDSKHYKLLDYYGTMTTLSILYFHARPRKSLYERFTSTQGKPPRKQETKTSIQNLLVVAVLVAGVTFAGAIQMPQIRDKNNSREHLQEFNSTATASHNSTALDSPTGSSLLDGYLCLDVWALNTSVVAAIILLWTNLNDVKFAPFAVWFSSLMVGGSIYMMCLSFFFAVSIALGGSNYGVFAIIVIVVGIVFFVAQTLLYIQWILPPSVNQIIEGKLSHYVYYISFFMLVYNWRCLTYSPRLHKLRDLWTKPK
ncbi:PREDICTED: alpha-latrocrustotoxin-Lt1a-like [Populus euphratica]|uniref:Alpha-latrocrustotoxin-Lt1a-like n=1 Tax=Populus euphratica TaxID=75702 RepID=A0AAJ6UW72_POPEU|nr:PREDICTED: alpha-latrocrustotoxin-Lt1a-like [Populus euphratica]